MTITSRSVLVALALTCSLVNRGAADPAEEIAPRVELTIVAGPERADVVEERVVSWFRAKRQAVETARMAALDPEAVLGGAGRAGVQIWIVLTDPQLAQVFFAVRERDAGAPRYLVTDVTLATGLDELGIEQLAQVVYPSAVALWAGNVESSRADVEQELRHRPGDDLATSRPLFLEPPPPEPENATPWGVSVGAEYGVAITGAGLAQLVGAQASITRDVATVAHVGPRLHLAALVPRDTTEAGVQVELSGAAAALGASVTGSRGRARALTAELGAGIELVRYRTGALADPTFMATNGGLSAQPLLYARGGLAVSVGRMRVGLDATLDVHLLRTHYDVIADGREVAVIVPWLVQPGLAARVAW